MAGRVRRRKTLGASKVQANASLLNSKPEHVAESCGSLRVTEDTFFEIMQFLDIKTLGSMILTNTLTNKFLSQPNAERVWRSTVRCSHSWLLHSDLLKDVTGECKLTYNWGQTDDASVHWRESGTTTYQSAGFAQFCGAHLVSARPFTAETIPGEFSLTAWVQTRIQDIPAGKVGLVCNLENQNNNRHAQGWALSLDLHTDAFNFQLNSTNYSSGNIGVFDGCWHHLCVVVETDHLKMYCDAVKHATRWLSRNDRQPASPSCELDTRETRLRIGTWDGTDTTSFTGRMWGVCLHDFCLTEQQIGLMHTRLPPTSVPLPPMVDDAPPFDEEEDAECIALLSQIRAAQEGRDELEKKGGDARMALTKPPKEKKLQKQPPADPLVFNFLGD
eukprot:TRINITY_DN59907_c0_g1_i1.p1 TRINITY_DN59907_c0_g1~~TRINITY_DN59907_c0_g1_i1.p1  ORF type:complete len:402 (+),score=36.11 TRINITY_DN59907_c0_g1_i1:43-1206(+)